MTDIEKVARAIWDQQRNHWGHYRDMVPDLCEWEELTQSKQRELMREAKAAIAAMQPAPQEPVDSPAEITRLTEALRAAEEREKALREALGQLSSYVGTGIGDEGTTSEQFIKRITWGIDHISNAQLTFAAEIVEECSKIPQTTWGEVKQAILARQALAGAKP